MQTNKLDRAYRKIKWFLSVYMWPPHEAKIQTPNGLLSFHSRDRTLGRSLYVNGEFEYQGMCDTYRFLHANNYMRDAAQGAVLDVGGYIGMISTGFVLSGMFRRAITVEPNPESYRLIIKNIEQNDLRGKMQAFNVALSDRNDVLEMELSNKNYGDHRIKTPTNTQEDHYRESERKTIRVKSMAFDDFCAEHPEINPQEIKLVWMDVQGHEARFIRGAQGFFAANKNVPVVMEFWPYAIKRSGVDKAQFVDIVSRNFNSVILLDQKSEVRPIAEAGRYFEKYEAPESGAHMLLLNT